jgi:hypothetical protein
MEDLPMANAASWLMQLRPVTYSGDAAKGDQPTYDRTEACGDFGPPLSKKLSLISGLQP